MRLERTFFDKCFVGDEQQTKTIGQVTLKELFKPEILLFSQVLKFYTKPQE